MYLIHRYQFLAYSAAMEGRRAETVKALRDARAAVPDAMLLAMPGLDWSIGYLYDGMARFGLWDEFLAEPAPDPKLTGLTIGYLQARRRRWRRKAGSRRPGRSCRSWSG